MNRQNRFATPNYQSPLQAVPAPQDEEVQEVASNERKRLAQEADEMNDELSPEERVRQFLKEYHNIPPHKVDEWKKEYGQIYLLPFDDNEIYIYRPIKAIEFTNLMIRLQNMANVTNDTSDAELVRLCVIYPKLDPIAFNTMPAGFLSSMRIAIQKASRFLTEEEISHLTIKL